MRKNMINSTYCSDLMRKNTSRSALRPGLLRKKSTSNKTDVKSRYETNMKTNAKTSQRTNDGTNFVLQQNFPAYEGVSDARNVRSSA